MSRTPRIASLLPGATEIVYALGAGDGLVARSHQCDAPAAAERVPVCTSTRLELNGSSYGIDERVKAILQDGLSIYRVDADLLATLRPDVIITQDQCEVCAVSAADVVEATCSLLDPEPLIVVLRPMALEHVFADIRRVGAAVNRRAEAVRLVESMVRGFDQVSRAAPANDDERPTVGIIEWLDPPMSAGNWMPTLVDTAGGRPLFGRAGEHSPWLDWGRFLDADPDVVVVIPCGYGIQRTLCEFGAVEARPGWADLMAVRTGRVYVADGNHYFNRPGPRLVDSARILGQILHPARFPSELRGRGWIRLGGPGHESGDPSSSSRRALRRP